LRAAARIKGPLCDHLVRDHMTEDLLVAQPDDKIPEVMGWMTEHRVRHLPVVQDEQLMGVVSIGDIVKAQHHQLSMENHYLKNYIQS
jgi:CBS domain-containing protein